MSAEQQTPQLSAATPVVSLEAKALPVLNYAMQQCGAAAIQSITVRNLTQQPLTELQLQICAVPAFAAPFSQHISLLPAGSTVTLTRPKLILDGGYLAGMTEKLNGLFRITLQQGDVPLSAVDAETSVLAFDEWHGISTYPELLAAFVTPNHPQLGRIIARATEFLGEWTGDTSMDGYQSRDPNRILQQAAAIFTAIKELAIAYAVPPASFELHGQRVRLCDTVLQQKLGTCLDLTLLYAACLEAVGLRPLLITTVGHIFTGVWLDERMFPECVQDDVSLITKRLASGINEIAVVETTCVTTRSDYSFDDARSIGEQNLTRQQVEYIIDVRRARMSGIVPLPQRIPTESGWEIRHDPSFDRDNLTAPAQLGETIHLEPGNADSTLPKKAQWERKLLDLGMRNTLINLRLTKTQLPILTGSLDELENALADGSDFTIMPKPADWHLGEFSFDALTAVDSGSLQADFEGKRLRSVYPDGELNRVIKELYRTARAALEENGANTLYLALGMLKWYESKRSTKARYAPIILLPIEMVRKSAAHGYVIRLRDDEPQMNITLLEKLKQDFGIVVGGVDPLPCDEHGIDIRKVLTILRQAIMEQPHWDVLEAASIGIFSFSQFVMWNDIRNRTEDLLENKVVRSLIDGKLAWEAEPLELGERVPEDNVLLPMPADASQLYAIQAACNGESFVLHGPPGTGKSQTITSLIANALAQGKRVLFVAEKMAALQVVQKRLEAIGIGPFCLELHSNKSKKRDVLEQLRKASEVTKTKSAEDFAQKADQIAAMRRQLDLYTRQLHKVRKCGSDLYQLINDYEAVKDAPELDAYQRSFLQELTRQDIAQQELAVARLVAAAQEIGHPQGHPLTPVTCTQYTQSLRAELQPTVNGYQTQLRRLQSFIQPLCQTLEQAEPVDYDQVKRLARIAAAMNCWYSVPAAWHKAANPQQYFSDITALSAHALRADQLEQQLLQAFQPDFLQENGQQLLAEHDRLALTWFLPRALGLRKLHKRVNLYANTPITKEALRSHLALLREQQQERSAADELLKQYSAELGSCYQGRSTDWEKLTRMAEAAQKSAQALYELTGGYELMHAHCGKAELRPTVQGIRDTFPAFNEAKAGFDRLLGIRKRTEAHWLDGQLALCDTILENADSLKEWIAFMGAAAEAKTLGLVNVVNAYSAGISHEDLPKAYQKCLLQGLIAMTIDSSGALNQFSGAVFNKRIEQYLRADQEWTRLSQQEIYCRLASKVPDFTREASHSSELGILQRCIKSGGRGTSIRKLFDQIPNLLNRLCPCMLMSPISAAQYLDPKREPFDIVVFDEASQLPTCKAVGVLARGKNAVIVGDPKQMPPTSFFATNTVDEDNLEIEDLESILDDCLALNMPQSHLLWHYRSRHESLIAFSNSQFYENKLFTFPSVNDRESKVQLVPVEGVFERGKARVNKEEARAVVEEIRRRSQDPALSGQSLGVVTFNISQQHLIDDLLTEACAQDPDLEKWVFGGEEPVFIKNLENVQGDERDVILFSVGFGPDENGKVYMNFGPLNRDGGWRRLNVAVSRARCEMMVFSTLRAEDLDLSRTQAEGVAALRSFLEYAQGRALALSENGLTPRSDCDGIAKTICRVLKKYGYDTDLSVGRSEYRIDIAVIDPKQPDRYLLGILLDGVGYGSAKTTRDREIAQRNVLQGLGWQLLRIWSMDWWDNRKKEMHRILKKLEALQNAPQQPEPSEEAPQPTQAPPPVVETTEPPQPIQGAPVYQATTLPAKHLTAEALADPKNLRSIQTRVERVLTVEAPISATLLTRRVVQSFGIARAGTRIQTLMQNLLEQMALTATTQENLTFYWSKEHNPMAYAGFRVNGDGENRRDILDVPVQEVANAICIVLYEQVSMGAEALLREISKKLGYGRVGGNVLSVLELGLQYAQAQGFIIPGSNGTWILSDAGTARAEATLQSF